MALPLCFLLMELCIFGIEEMLSGHFFESQIIKLERMFSYVSTLCFLTLLFSVLSLGLSDVAAILFVY